MIKRTASFFWSLRTEMIKYGIIGVSSVIIDITSLIVLKESLGILPVTAVIINQIFILGYVFFLNKYWTFKNKHIPSKQLIRFIILAIWNYIFAVIAMYIFNNLLEFDYIIVRLVEIAVAVSWNFFLYKYWVYREVSTGTDYDLTNN